MANIYVRSTDGNNADNGSTWALAKLDLVGAAGIDAAGDTIWVSQNHAESTAAAIAPAWEGTAASPIKILCGNDAATPPTALATTATVTTTGNSNINIAGNSDYVYVYGISFIAGSGASGTALVQTVGSVYLEECNLRLASTGTGSRVHLGATLGVANLNNCGFRFAASAQGVVVANSGNIIRGGSILAGGTSPTAFILTASECSLLVDGFDFSNAAAALNLASATGIGAKISFRNCKLPSSWSGSLHSGTPGAGSVYEMFNCDSGDTNHKYQKATQFGTIVPETTLVRTGGASDGTTTFSYKMVTNANAEHPMLTLDSPAIRVWGDTTGSAKTYTVEILHDSATNLKDNEVWLEAMYLGTSGVPLALFASDGISVVATPADQAASSETWTTTGMANPNKQKLSVTVTPQEKGPIDLVVRMAKASYTLYVDPEVAIT